MKSEGVHFREGCCPEQHKDADHELEAGIKAEPFNASAGLHLLTISKALERAADRATNIAEEVVFLVRGQDIRHAGR